MRHYVKSEFKVVPWKNGQGVTTELFRIEDPVHPEEFLFRLSRAEVNSSGDFSIFPMVDRQLLLLKGEGFKLRSQDFQKTIDAPWEIFHFNGEDFIQCELLNGPCEDFNIMVKRNWKKVMTILIHPEKDLELITDHQTLIYNVSREELWALGPKENLTLKPGDFIVIQLID